MSGKTLLCALMMTLLALSAGAAFAGETGHGPDARAREVGPTMTHGAARDQTTSLDLQVPLLQAMAEQSTGGECSINCTCEWSICVGDDACCDDAIDACKTLQHLCLPHF